ncbi:universal stress protein [Billgrantia diversa]|uniref:universal stress protein n=1 Tax=Halomonas sp. MCCC 1A13316 TaxID=2733487 RepID=UPI0018A56845|nr:universal stress protein [Halomonas sp. MCCC 1A13316]QOR38383.1 universal stress protein [Halomonas sp. MCCC 1A13316]
MFKHILVAVDYSPAWPLLQARLKTLTTWGNEQVEFLLGSTDEAIARDAYCPVLVLPKEMD